jgi:2-polyprenyl-3-methyl-5-hydroxy-6-metoxy-1,4-benzoquinol methylase
VNRKSNSAWNRVDKDLVDYNIRQYEQKYRSTEFVIESLQKEISTLDKLNILDVGCGGGGNLSYIAKNFENCSFTGIDINGHFVQMAKKKHLEENINNTKFEHLDFAEIKVQYDVIGSSQFLEVLDFKSALSFVEKCFSMSKKSVYFQALFTNRDLDYEINIHDHKFKKSVPYNIYSIKTISNIAKKFGFYLKQKTQFIIDIDLPDVHEGRGTYTIKDNHGKRMMFSDVLNLPWYFLYYEKTQNNQKEGK